MAFTPQFSVDGASGTPASLWLLGIGTSFRGASQLTDECDALF